MFQKQDIPKLYIDMVNRLYTDKTSDSYIWLFELEWLNRESVMNYIYEENESLEILPFAITGHGDKWVFVNNNTNEPLIGRCYLEDTEGTYYAKNLEDAIVRNIIEFVSSSSFYINEKYAESYQINDEDLRRILKKYYKSFDGMIRIDYLKLISDFIKMPLKKYNDNYCHWYALLSPEDADVMIRNCLNFDLMGHEFSWCT